MSWPVSVLILSLYFIIYAVVHSLLAARPVKNWLHRRFGAGLERWYRLAYNIFAGVTFLPLLVLLPFLPDRLLYVVPAPWRWLMMGGQFLALVALGLSLLQTDVWFFLGLAQLTASQPARPGGLEVKGFYAWVRHPLYLFSLIFLWLTPAMTVNVLVVYILFSLYFYIGTFYEERRLLAEFGPAYVEYQRQVPRLLPRPPKMKLP